ncbi:MAG: Mg chelatase, cobalamin biosynthesis protein CobN [Clostridia bacterium 41_269]|nr:MAG: Mg chelatase, cobalamin biosynthesis protein CobN [Clostridia bacterium 41_269]
MKAKNFKVFFTAFVLLAIFWCGEFFLEAEVAEGTSYTQYRGVSYGEKYLSAIKFRDVGSHWAKVPIYRSAAQGLIFGYGSGYFRPNSPVTREEAAAMLVRLKGVGGDDLQNNGGTGGSWASPHLQVALDEGIITEQEKSAMEKNPGRYAQRQQVAAWAAKVLELEPDYSIGYQLLRSFKDWQKITSEYTPFVAASVREGVFAGSASGYFKPNASISRGEMAAVLDRLSQRLAEDRGLVFAEGKVTGSEAYWEETPSGRKKKVEVMVQKSSGETVLIKSGGTDGDYPVYRGGKLGLSDLLKSGDYVKMVLTENGEVLFVEVSASASRALTGTFVGLDLDGKKIYIRDFQGKDLVLPIQLPLGVTINGMGVEPQDLIPGQEVSLTVKGGAVTAVAGILDKIPDIYGESRREVVEGVVKNVSSSGDEITVASGNRQLTFRIDSRTAVIKRGTPYSPKWIKAGDSVKVQTVGGGYASRVEVFSGEKTAAGIIRGRIEGVSSSSGRIVLSGVERYFYGGWYADTGSLVLKVSPNAEIYDISGRVDVNWLEKSAAGREIYAVIAESFGSPEAQSIYVKSGYSESRSGLVDEIDFSTARMYLEDGFGGIIIGPQTSVVRNGRLISVEDVEEGASVFVETDRVSGEEYGAFILWDDFIPTGWSLIRGEIDEVDDGEITLSSYSLFDDNDWDEPSSSSKDRDLEVSTEAVIIDAVDPQNPKTLEPEDFFYTRFTSDYENKFAVALVYDDLVKGLVILDGEPSGDRTSIGVVSSASGGKINIDRVRDWSSPVGEWKVNRYSVSLSIKGAAVVRKGEVYAGTGVRSGDTVFVLHDMNSVHVVFVQ